MSTRKPRIFIGSSKKSVQIANALQTQLGERMDAIVWNQGIFDLARTALDSLLRELDRADFGLFVLAPDDVMKVGGKDELAVRDNVVFELGLFAGRLGMDRTFGLRPRGGKIKIPSDLAGITMAEYDPATAKRNAIQAVAPACMRIMDKVRQVKLREGAQRDRGAVLDRRIVFTETLLDRLRDKKVKKVRIVSYTTEVDYGNLRFNIEGSKAIEVYKRSILSDLAEQQECNVQRIAANSSVKPWQKRSISINVSEQLEQNVHEGSTLTQYLYDSPPSFRAYMFDSKEAVLGYYKVLRNPLKEPGSVYKGMDNPFAIHVYRGSRISGFLLDQLEEYFAALRRSSRTWPEERAILLEDANWKGGGRRPCVRPLAVFIDLDGVLYDSLGHYIRAWHEAFGLIGVEFPKERVYEEEGRRGRETIVRYLTQIGRVETPAEVIERINDKKREVLQNLGVPKVMPGAEELVNAIISSGLKVRIVTGSTNKSSVTGLTEAFGGRLRPEQVIDGTQVRAGKPNPEPYLLACQQAEVHPHEAIVIENAPLGIESADAAGTFCIGVKTGPLSEKVLRASGARAVFNSCRHLADRWDRVVDTLRK